MGGQHSKRSAQVIPIEKVSAKIFQNSGSRYIITPQLCSNLLKTQIKPQTPVPSEDLKSISTMIRVKPAQILQSAQSTSTDRTRLEKEIGLVLYKRQSCLGWRSKLQLKARISDLQHNSTGQPMERMILKKLSKLCRLPLPVEIFLLLRNVLSSNSQFYIDAKDLRKSPSAVISSTSKPGLDLAHVLSLSLSATLWKLVMGTTLIDKSTRKSLKHALAHPCNFQVVCQHTNRVLHVAYDAEIVSKLTQAEPENSENPSLSSGARKRLKQIIQVNRTLAAEFSDLQQFCNKSNVLLTSLL